MLLVYIHYKITFIRSIVISVINNEKNIYESFVNQPVCGCFFFIFYQDFYIHPGWTDVCVTIQSEFQCFLSHIPELRNLSFS